MIGQQSKAGAAAKQYRTWLQYETVAWHAGVGYTVRASAAKKEILD